MTGDFWDDIPVLGPVRRQVITSYEGMTEDDWNGIPIVGDIRRTVIDGIPDSFWNDIPVLGQARQALLTLEDMTSVPAWLWLLIPAAIVLLIVIRLVIG